MSLATEDIHSPHERPERALWRAVVLQALLDATNPGKGTRLIRAKHEAIYWFTATLCSTAACFKDACRLADIDPIYMKSFALKVISGEQSFIRRRINLILMEEKL